jgi:hypothetical protein
MSVGALTVMALQLAADAGSAVVGPISGFYRRITGDLAWTPQSLRGRIVHVAARTKARGLFRF